MGILFKKLSKHNANLILHNLQLSNSKFQAAFVNITIFSKYSTKVR